MTSRIARAATIAGVVAAGGLAAAPARAVYQCGPQKDDCKCGMDDPYPCCENGGNCTWWAWEAACCNWAVGLPGWGNANQWAGNAKAHPNYDVIPYPVVGSIANKVSSQYGHVAWVTAVNGSKITVTEQGCWSWYGMKTSTYDWKWFDGGFIVRTGQCECKPGESQSESCGNCGKRGRGCSTSCKWGGWGACEGGGACTPGQVEDKACGDCGKQSHTCQANCAWGALGACAGPDPGGACDTGQKGVCAQGTKKCVDGKAQCATVAKPSPETCDGKDNDCNGQVDDGAGCSPPGGGGGGDGGSGGGSAAGGGGEGGRTGPTSKDAGAPAPKPPAASPDDGEGEAQPGCACRAGSGTGAAAGWPVAAVAALCAARRRARRSRRPGERATQTWGARP